MLLSVITLGHPISNHINWIITIIGYFKIVEIRSQKSPDNINCDHNKRSPLYLWKGFVLTKIGCTFKFQSWSLKLVCSFEVNQVQNCWINNLLNNVKLLMYFCVLSLTIFLTLTLHACQMKSIEESSKYFWRNPI